jgi:hypothetical protein
VDLTDDEQMQAVDAEASRARWEASRALYGSSHDGL